MSRLVGLVNLSRPLRTQWFACRRLQSTFSGETVSLKVRDGVAIVTFDNKKEKINSLGEKLFEEVQPLFRRILNDSSVKAAVVISGKPDNFIVGADIRMLEKVSNPEEAEKLVTEGHILFNEIERSQKPVVAAIMGQCLGGGLETALACHYRIAVNNKKTVVGLPEVMLGILPGAGGTQRLPRLIDPTQALQLMLTGKHVEAKKAKKLGIVDQLVEPLGPGLEPPEQRTLKLLEDVAVETAKSLASGSLKPNRSRPLLERIMRKALDFKFVQDFVFKKATEQVMKLTGGLYPAPLKIIEVVRTGIEKGFDAGIQAERKGFAQLLFTSHSRALVGLFHGQTQCKKNAFGKPAKEARTVGVLGAGLMGAGIATVSIDKAGHKVIMKDANNEALFRGETQIRGVLDGKVKKKKMTIFERDVTLSKLVPTVSYEGFQDCDIVIEAVVEDINVKHKVLNEIESICRPDTIFATNTSAISIASIAKASKRPENVIGMHYFSPVEKMPLLEIVTYDKTSKEACARAVDVGLKQGKVVITVKDSPAFYTTRILAFAMSEVLHILLEGEKPQDMDKLTKKMGFPVGLVTLIDEVGIDTGAHIQNYLKPIFGSRLSPYDASAYKEFVDSGAKGRKSGKGFYIYSEKKTKGSRPLNPKAEELLKKYHVAPKRVYTAEEKQMRILSRFTNEALLCLQEGILANPVEGDIGAVFGLGYPPFHGGPFRYVDTIGASKLLQWMEQFQSDMGETFTPCQLLKDYAKDPSKKFHPRK